MAKKKNAIANTLEVVKQGRKTYIHIPSSIIKILGKEEKLYCAIVNGVLQISSKKPVMVIPFLKDMDDFNDQRF